MEHDAPDLAQRYREDGFGTRIGFGQTPAVLAVDLVRAFTDPSMPFAIPVRDAVEAAARTARAARESGVTVIHAVVRYGSPLEAPALIAKNPVLGQLLAGTELVEIDPRLGPEPGEPVLAKTGASAFFNTPLAPLLQGLGVDTLVIVGTATSGCIRATTVDAIQYGFRPIIPREAVGDRYPQAHEAALAELDAKYADVEPIETVLAWLRAASPSRAPLTHQEAQR